LQLALLPSSPALAGAEIELVEESSREFRLRNALTALDGKYDYILIDCPPSLGILTVNGLVAARDGVLVPVHCEYLALEGSFPRAGFSEHRAAQHPPGGSAFLRSAHFFLFSIICRGARL
jgi:hypothetical protein